MAVAGRPSHRKQLNKSVYLPTSTVVVAAGIHCVTGIHSMVVVREMITLVDRAGWGAQDQRLSSFARASA